MKKTLIGILGAIIAMSISYCLGLAVGIKSPSIDFIVGWISCIGYLTAITLYEKHY